MTPSTVADQALSGDEQHSKSWARNASVIVLWSIIAVVAITLAIIIATLNRGFDWSDEGFVYSMIASNRVSTNEFWGFQHLLHPLYEMFGSSILAFRVVRLLGYIALAVTLTFIARRVLDSLGISLRRSSWIFVLLIAQVGTFAAWSYPPRYLGYNELSAWFAQLGGALLILLLTARHNTLNGKVARWRTRLVWALIGAIIAILFFAKVTAAIILIILTTPVVLITARSAARVMRISALIVGMASMLVILLAAGVPLLTYAETISELMLNPAGQAASGYSIGALLITYLNSAALTMRELAVPIGLAALILLTSRGLTRKPGSISAYRGTSALENVALIATGVLALLLLLPSANTTWNALGVANTFMFFLALLSFAVLAPKPTTPQASIHPHRSSTWLVVFLFAVIPFINGVGTNNAIFGQTVFSATFWAVGAGVFLCLLWERTEAASWFARLSPLLIIGIVVSGSGLAVAHDVFVDPYRTAPYFKQNTAVDVADLSGIRVSQDQAELFQWLHDVGLKEKAANTPALSIATPGALLAFNLSDWANLWPGPDWAESIEEACKRQFPTELYVLQSDSEKQPGSSGYDKLVAGLDGCNIEFPRDFSIVDAHISQDPEWSVTIWQMD